MKTDLNPWHRVLWRRLVRRLRRVIYSFDTPMRRRLYDQKREITCRMTLTPSELLELVRINHKLGNGSIHRFTPEQRQRQADLASAALRRISEE